jgi:hypothetical protein
LRDVEEVEGKVQLENFVETEDNAAGVQTPSCNLPPPSSIACIGHRTVVLPKLYRSLERANVAAELPSYVHIPTRAPLPSLL